MPPSVTILILNWNGGPDTVTCLDSLKELRYPNFRVIVLDNASSDNSGELFAKYPKPDYPLEFIQTGANLGFGGGNNVGLRKALAEGTDYVWLLNNDSAVTPESLNTLIVAAESDPAIGIAGPLTLTMDEPPQVWFAGGTFNWLKTRGVHPWYGENPRSIFLEPSRGEGASALRQARGIPQRPMDVDYITGGIMLIKRAVFDDIGLLPGDYFLYYEDADFNTRAAKQSWRRILVPQAVVYHKGSASAKAGSPNYQYYHLRNGLMFSWRHGPSRVLTVAASLWLAAKELVKIIIGYHRERSIGGLHGVIDFWRGNTGARKA